MTFTYWEGPFDDARLERRKGELNLFRWGKVIAVLRTRVELKSQVEWVFEAGMLEKGEILKGSTLPKLALVTFLFPLVGAMATAETVKNAMVDQVIFICNLRDHGLFTASADRKTFEEIRSYAKTDPPEELLQGPVDGDPEDDSEADH